MPIECIDVKRYFPEVVLNGAKSLEVKQSLSQVAKAFDDYFLQGMLKSENIAQHFEQDALQSATSLTKVQSGVDWAPTQQSSSSAPPPQVQSGVGLAPAQQPLSQDFNKHSSVEDFVRTLWPYAVKAAQAMGLDPKVLIAQAGLETGWGRSIAKDADGSSSHNLFNIKARTGETVQVQTTEFMDGMPVKMMASFKKYLSVADSFADYVAFIQNNPRYQTALQHVNDPVRYVHALQQAGYATDPGYADKIMEIYHSQSLNL